MDLGSALNSIMEYDIRKHCHINSNEDGDRFVGIKADSDNAMVYFPIGYELPETDAEIRTDIKHLIMVFYFGKVIFYHEILKVLWNG